MAWARRASRRGIREEPVLVPVLTYDRLWNPMDGRARTVVCRMPWCGYVVRGLLRGGVTASWWGWWSIVLRGSRWRGPQADSRVPPAGSGQQVNTGRSCPLVRARACLACGCGWERRPVIGDEAGGAAVVLRAGESPCTWGRAAARMDRRSLR